jgi:hypothetical protein
MAMSKKRVLAVAFTSILTALMLISQANAQSIPKPSTPQFSIQYIDYSYDIPATNSTDPYTGQQIFHPSQHFEDIRIEGKIKNQPFTRYYSPNPPDGAISGNIGFYYNVRYKGHFGNDWIEIYGYHNVDFPSQNYSSEYTNFTIYWQEFPEGAQIDYQVKAMIGFEGYTYTAPWGKPIIIGEESEWSNTLTLFFTKNQNAIAYASNIDAIPYPILPTPPLSPTSTTELTPTSDATIKPSAEPTSTPKSQNGFLGTNLPVGYGYAIITIIVMSVVAGLSLIYFEKLRKKV